MTTSLQTILALVIVTLAAIGFVIRWWCKRGKSGCGGSCGCSSSTLKITKQKRQ